MSSSQLELQYMYLQQQQCADDVTHIDSSSTTASYYRPSAGVAPRYGNQVREDGDAAGRPAKLASPQKLGRRRGGAAGMKLRRD